MEPDIDRELPVRDIAAPPYVQIKTVFADRGHSFPVKVFPVRFKALCFKIQVLDRCRSKLIADADSFPRSRFLRRSETQLPYRRRRIRYPFKNLYTAKRYSFHAACFSLNYSHGLFSFHYPDLTDPFYCKKKRLSSKRQPHFLSAAAFLGENMFYGVRQWFHYCMAIILGSSLTGSDSFGISSLRTPSLYSALMSSSFRYSPT